tara:strand:+ start:367 stop:1029 length:663 start_codon:yes stop_codon:yes gene_type:complete
MKQGIIFILLLGLGFSQTELTTRVYNTGSLNSLQEIDIDSMVGFDIGNGSLAIHNIIFDISTSSCNVAFRTIAPSTEYWTIWVGLRDDGSWHPYGEMTLIDGYNYSVSFGSCPVNSFELELAITAEFPEEDTGYIEEGHDFCLLSGQNLVSFPCENPISLESAIPEQALDNMTSIIGQGVAAQPLPNGDWVGSLQELQPTQGYWFRATTGFCFEYDCVEN